MGFFKSCWEMFIELTMLSHMIDQEFGQQPLRLPQEKSHQHDHTPQSGVVFTPQNASAGFTCQYPTLTKYEFCGSAHDRKCWLQGPAKAPTGLLSTYNVTTDYESYSPPGVKREYWLNVSQIAIAPDGYLKPLGQVLNNTYPGPLLEACWGDEIVVHVTNYLPDNGTTIHWHGMRQLHTNQMDGVNGVTQCPIAQGDTFTYEFKAGQYGHTWYHSHYSLQYSDGVAAPLTIYGPCSANFDEALEPILINDWVHDRADAAFHQELGGGAPLTNSIIFGGAGNYRCSDLDPFCCTSCSGLNPNFCIPDPRCVAAAPGARTFVLPTIFQTGKRYLLRLVNASAGAMFIFSIDGHELEVIETDLVPISPYKTKSLFVGIGQRYEIVVTAKPSPKSADGNYWIRTRVADGCGNVEQDDETTGILRYEDAISPPPSTPSTLPNDNRHLCQDEPVESILPMVKWKVNPNSFHNFKNISNYTFEAGIDSTSEHGAFRWDLTDTPMWLNFSDPTLLNLEAAKADAEYAVIPYDFSGGYVYLVIDGSNLDNLKRPIPAAHPIHLHGHDFVILRQDYNSSFNPVTEPAKFNYNNPPRRDVALLPSGGYLALAFKPDNAGIWLVHCHIAFHASSGLALQIMERQEEIYPSLGSLKSSQETCEGWNSWNLQFTQDDSGI